jgi:hypothetical protein
MALPHAWTHNARPFTALGSRLLLGRRPLPVVTMAAMAVTLLLPAARADFTIEGPTHGVPTSVLLSGCPPGQIGTSTIDPVPVTHLADATATSMVSTAFAADKATQFPDWTIAFGGNILTGVLTINDYFAEDRPDKGACRGGARMDATYAPGPKDPANLTFIQVFTDNYGTGTHIDPFPNDDTKPFYYTDQEQKDHGLNFIDRPNNSCLKPDFVYVNRFDTYLVSFSGTTATVYDGWEWGYDLVCTAPEPSSLVTLSLAAGCFAIFGLGKNVMNKWRQS